MSCFVSAPLCFSAAFVKIMKGNKNVCYQSYGGGVPFKQAVNPEERVTHSLRNPAAAPHMAGEACPHGATPGVGWGGACLPHVHPRSFSSFCPQYPELLVASYNNNEDAPHEPDGVALVWNMKYKKATPEYVFHCQVPRLPSASLFHSSPRHRWGLLP